jgi:hypothetical protein
MNANDWRQECNYISDAMDDMLLRHRMPRGFNNDPACFMRYCIMQRDSATHEGFYDAAQYIQHCIDDQEAAR